MVKAELKLNLNMDYLQMEGQIKRKCVKQKTALNLATKFI